MCFSLMDKQKSELALNKFKIYTDKPPQISLWKDFPYQKSTNHKILRGGIGQSNCRWNSKHCRGLLKEVRSCNIEIIFYLFLSCHIIVLLESHAPWIAIYPHIVVFFTRILKLTFHGHHALSSDIFTVIVMVSAVLITSEGWGLKSVGTHIQYLYRFLSGYWIFSFTCCISLEMKGVLLQEPWLSSDVEIFQMGNGVTF